MAEPSNPEEHPSNERPSNERLVLLLAQHLAAGSIEADQALPALRELLGEAPSSLLELQDALADAELTQAASLQEAIQERLCEEAREAEAAPAGFPEDLPRGWVERAQLEPVTRDLIAKTRQRAYLGLEGEPGQVGEKVRTRFGELLEEFQGFPHPWSQLGLSLEDISAPARPAWEARLAFEREQALSGQVPASLLNEEAFLGALCEAFSASQDRAFQAALLDRLLAWPTPVVAPFLWRVCDSRWAQARACALLSFRFQEPQWSTWESVSAWLQWTQNQTPTRPERGATFASAAPELSFVWYSQIPQPAPEVTGLLVAELSERVAGVERQRLFAGHQVELSAEEQRLLAAPAGRLVTLVSPDAVTAPATTGEPLASDAPADAGTALASEAPAPAEAPAAVEPDALPAPEPAALEPDAPPAVAAREALAPSGEEVPFDAAWLEANAAEAGASAAESPRPEPTPASSGIPLDPALLRAALPASPEPEHAREPRAPFEWRPIPAVARGRRVDPLAAPAEPRFRREPVPPTPSVWEEHLRPLLAENWYMVVGLAMVLVGASLLAVYTWDRSPLLRYSLVPSLLALFTLGLGEVGFRLGKREVLRGTGLLLAGAAVALIPLNFVIVDLAAAEERLPARWLIAIVLAVIYAAVFSLALRRWSKAAHEDLAVRLVLPLMVLNVLSAALPLLLQFTGHGRGPWVLAAGAYLGLGVLSWGVLGVCRLLTKELLRERTTYLFAGAALFMTYLQGLLWSHVGAGTFPALSAFPLLIVLGGGLVLRVERAFLRVADEHGHRAESFLGFGLILLGVVAGFASPLLRVVCLFVAGVIWLIQATRREGVMHHFIGVLLLVGGACAIGIYDWFPRGGEEVNGLPFLGLSILVALGILRAGARSFENEGLATAAMEIQPFVLALTGVVSVLSQWHYHSQPLHTAAVLAVCAGVFFVRAIREERLDWVHSGALLLAVCLPYLGCADMVERTLPSNALVFGLGVLAWLWIGALALSRHALLLKARSTVLTLYGALAISAMILRIFVDGGPSAEVSDLRVTLDLIGPVLLTASLAVATYCARSLLPALLGAIVMAVLFPELKAEVKRLLPFVTWGSGLGSAVSGAGLIVTCFVLNRVERFRDLGQGDLIMDQVEFPLQRRDASLFTIPLGIAALILATKGLLQHLPRNYSRGLPLKTAVALLIHGFTWSGLTALWRRLALSRLTIHLAWISVTLGIVLGYYRYGVDHQLVLRAEAPALAWLLTLSLWTLGLELWARRVEWVREALLVPIRAVARAGTWSLGLGLCAASFFVASGRLLPLAALTLAALVWHALASKHLRYGLVAFLLSLPFVASLGHPTLTLEARLGEPGAWSHLVLLCLGVQALMLTLEFRRPDYQRFRGLLAPFHQGTSLVTLGLALILGIELVAGHAGGYSRFEQGALLLVLGLVARGQRSGLIAFAWCGLAYLIAHGTALVPLELQARLRLLSSPLSLTVWAAAIALGGALLRPAHEARPRRFLGSFPALGTHLAPLAELYLPVLCVTLVAVALHGLEFRHAKIQLLAPYLAAASVFLMSRDLLRGPLRILGGLLLTLANIHLVNVLLVIPFLAAGGLSPTHVVCMGLILTLLQGSVVRRVVPREGVRSFVLIGNVALAGAVLLLLAVHYVSHANLALITSTRFVVSGLLAYAAGLYFRQAARNPQPPFQERGYQLEGCYHFGISLALWCLALLIPALRHPSTALIALGIAPLYFYLRAEYGEREGGQLGPIAVRYRDSAVVLCFFLVALYSAQGVFHLILFPSQTPDFFPYHAGAPVLLVVSLVLLRLRGLGASDWLSFYGALGLVAATYFGITAIPGASPFEHPVAGAWVALAVSHVFVVATGGPSPLRTFLQWISGLDGTTWHAQRRSVGMVTLVTTCIVLALGAWRAETPEQVAPLVFGLATIFIHHGAVTGLAWQRVVAFFLTLGALHADFFLPSYVPQESVRWILIAAWACAGLGYGGLRKIESPTRLANGFMILAFTCLGHAIYFHPESAQSWLLACAFLTLSVATPAERHLATRARDYLTSSLLLLGLPWLAFWAQSDLRGGGMPTDAWPLACLAAAVLGQGIAILRLSAPLADRLAELHLVQPRVFHLLADFWSAQRWRIFAGSLLTSTALMAILVFVHWGQPYPLPALALTSAVWAALAACWYRLGQARESLAWVLVAEGCAVALLLGLRQHLLLEAEFWTLEYDVWASLALTAILAGLKEVTASAKRHNRWALVGTMLLLPLLAIFWAVRNELGSDVTIVVVGVNSVILSVMGRSERKSPYNLLAVLGFVTFVVLVVYSKLGLRSLQAYVIPVGLGVFVLLRLFGAELPREARRKVESVTLFAMIGSSAYYALADLSHPIGFNLTLLAVCFGGMILGTLLRVRLYLGIGGGGILLCLASIAFKVVMGLGRTIQVSALGLLLLLAGVALVGGSAYYKANREQVLAKWESFLARFEGWE